MKLSENIGPRMRVGVVHVDPIRFVGLSSFLASEAELQLISISLSDTSTPPDTDVMLVWNHWSDTLFEAIAWLKAQNLNIPFVLIGSRTNDEFMLKALAYGAKGCIDESASPAEFAGALRTAQQGSIWVPRRVLSEFVERNQPTGQRRTALLNQPFTKREREVLQMLVTGHTNKEIGGPLGIEERTVKAHVSKLMEKVGVRNRIELSIRAITQSLVSPT